MPSAASRPMTIFLSRFALVGMGAPPSGEDREGVGEGVQPAGRFRLRQDDAVAVPCALHQAGRAHAVGRAEIDALGGAALVVGNVGGVLAGHLRGGDAVQIVAALERRRHGWSPEMWAAARNSMEE